VLRSSARILPRRTSEAIWIARAKEDKVMDVATCVTKDCDKPRFHEYYVCAEHFVVYAAPRYTESLLVKVEPDEPAGAVEPPPYPDAPSCDRGYYESPPPDPAQLETTKRARIS
jgi:hypothetical protein